MLETLEAHWPGMGQPSATVSATAEPERSGPLVQLSEESGDEGQEGGGWDGEDWPQSPLAGMYVSHSEMMFQLEEWQGMVSIEPPRVYFYFDPDPLSEDARPGRLALSLPYPRVRFDESTQTLWSRDIPISHGDRVLTGGNEGGYTVGARNVMSCIYSGTPAPPKECATSPSPT